MNNGNPALPQSPPAPLADLQAHLLREPRDLPALLQVASLLQEAGRRQEASAHFQRALQLDGGSFQALCGVGDCAAADGDTAAARKLYLRAATAHPARFEPRLGLGMLALRESRGLEALQHLRTARAISPECEQVYSGLAMAYQLLEDYSSAFDMYLQCLRLSPDNLTALLGMFLVSCHVGSFRRIIYYLELYLTRHPDDPAVLFCLASLYAREGRSNDAIRAALRVLSLDPGKAEALELIQEVQRRAPRPQGWPV